MTPIPEIPTATYRLQFNQSCTFKQARALVPYLHSLGISHIYASPYFRAGPESTHGYDICDHNELNPELGLRADYDALVSELHAYGMGQIVDFVPNHMGIGTPVNTWWMDVLENGPGSIYAAHFDIEWNPVKADLKNKVLLPILGDHYGRVLERGEFKIEFEEGAFFLRYFEAKLPLTPRSYVRLLVPALARLPDQGIEESFRLELQSIITALEYLPARTEIDPDKMAERAREKEITKRRLAGLCNQCGPVRKAIADTLTEIEGRAGDSRSFDAFDQLLNSQCYRLSYWRVASEEINYRRFFDVNGLAAIRMELPEVFDATHRLIFELIENGSINGLRLDHVDGLWRPREYLETLQNRVAAVLKISGKRCPLYLIVEKILLGDERLRSDWPIHGSTGYDFTNEVTGLFVQSASEKSLSETYHRFIGAAPRFEEIIYEKKHLVMRLALASEINMLGYMLGRLSEKNRWYRDFTLNALTAAVSHVIACFPVYRTYVAPGEEPSEADREAILRAVRLAKRRNPGIERSVFNFLGEILLMKFPENIDDKEREEHMRFVMKLQQCTSPVMAKGVEDTAFYIYNRLIALNEVGGEPQRFGFSREAFYERCRRRLEEHPHALLATSTHDTKRSEDVRTRIAVISEMPAQWRKSVRHWRSMNRRYKREIEGESAPDANEEYLIYQTLLGTWPVETCSREALETYLRRIQDYLVKAVKEAKINSSWIQPNEEWETALRDFVQNIIRSGPNRFLKDFEPVAAGIARAGAVNSLAQLVLKCTVPGVPDFYQGCELWDDRLVDPDNRQAVDYEMRKQALESIEGASVAELFQHWSDGRIKLFVTQKLLQFRRMHSRLFESGEFIPLKTGGSFAESCVAYLRRFGTELILAVVPRLTLQIGFPPVGDAWKETVIEFPGDLSGLQLRELFTGADLKLEGTLPVSGILRDLPVAVYTL